MVLSKEELSFLSGIPISHIGKIAPLTSTQRDLYLDWLINPDITSFSVGMAVHLGTRLDEDLWHKAISLVSNNDDILRTLFFSYNGEEYQFVDKYLSIHFEFIDLQRIHASQEEDVAQLILAKIKVPYDLHAREPLFKNYLLRDHTHSYIAITASHHILCDAPAQKIFLERSAAVYRSLLSQEKPDKTTWTSFYDCVPDTIAQFDTPEIQEYWRNQLQPVVPLGFSREPGIAQSISHRLVVTGEDLELVQAYCKANTCSVPAFFRSIYSILLSRYFDVSDDFVIYSLINGRPAGYKYTIGCFYQVLPIIVHKDLLSQKTPINEFLSYMRQYRRQLGEKQNISMLFQKQHLQNEEIRYYYNFYNFGYINFFDELLEFTDYDYYSPNEVHFVVNEKQDKLELSLHYDQEKFSDAFFLERIQALTRQILRGARYMWELDILLPKEALYLSEVACMSSVAFPQGVCFQQLFERQAEYMPDRIAVAYEDEQISYEALNQRANCLAQTLVEMGVGPEVIVAVLAERSIDFLIAILAIFKAGGAYLPLNIYSPVRQLSQVLVQSRSPLLLTSRGFLPTVTQIFASMHEKETLRSYLLEELLPGLRSGGNLPVRCTPDNMAYVIYTSGSTGVPKGAVIEHKGMLNHLYAKLKDLSINEADSLAQTAAQSFDISVWQFLAALLAGGRVQIMSDSSVHDPLHLLQQVEYYAVTILETVPSLIQGLLFQVSDTDEALPRLAALRWLISTGEALPPRLARDWLHRYPAIPLMNGYGPTECSDDITHYPICLPPPDTALHIPIGRPLANMRLFILDRHMQMMPVGAAGELYVSGIGVGRGYLHEPAKTAEVFLPGPFGQQPGGRLYKTGDIARYLPDGNLEFLGRADYQIKLRGFRIELGEIEAELSRYPAVQESVVLVKEEKSANKLLVAYVIPQPGFSPTQFELRSFLKERLPDYMLPAAFISLNAFPLTAHGKIDRKVLSALEISRSVYGESHGAACNPGEETLVTIWSQALGIKNIGVYANFFDLGGNSLSAIQIVSKIREVSHADISLRDLFTLPTIAELAHFIDKVRE